MDKREAMARAFCCPKDCICVASSKPEECWAVHYFGPRIDTAIAAGEAWEREQRLKAHEMAFDLPVPEPAVELPERCCDGVASVPVRDWMDAQRDFG